VTTEVGRCLDAGGPSAGARTTDAWRLRFQAPAGDVDSLRAAFTALLQDAGERPLRGYLKSPPHLRAAAANRRQPAATVDYAHGRGEPSGAVPEAG
jgi:hypothetical protein